MHICKTDHAHTETWINRHGYRQTWVQTDMGTDGHGYRQTWVQTDMGTDRLTQVHSFVQISHFGSHGRLTDKK